MVSTRKADAAEGRLTIGALSRATGIPVETLRTWERRYAFPVPTRKPSGHRVYPLSAVPRLRRVAEALARGHRPAEVVPISEAALETLLNALRTKAPAEPPAREQPAVPVDAPAEIRELARRGRRVRRRGAAAPLRAGLDRARPDGLPRAGRHAVPARDRPRLAARRLRHPPRALRLGPPVGLPARGAASVRGARRRPARRAADAARRPARTGAAHGLDRLRARGLAHRLPGPEHADGPGGIAGPRRRARRRGRQHLRVVRGRPRRGGVARAPPPAAARGPAGRRRGGGASVRDEGRALPGRPAGRPRVGAEARRT